METSITDPACGNRDPKNRPEQSKFECTACGFSAHADTVGAINIARRGIAMERITKGAKLAPIEQDMVARLRLRADGGLGPLRVRVVPSMATIAASGFVAVRVSAVGAHDPQGLTSSVGQDSHPCVQNARNGVFAERDAHLFGSPKRQMSFFDIGLLAIGRGRPTDVG